jgi:uncharacterized protein (TIGR02118 family)
LLRKAGGQSVAKFIVMYEEPKDKQGFEKYYNDVHMALVNEMPHILNASKHKVVHSQNTDSKMYLIAEIEYASIDSLNESLSSEAGKKVQEDAENLAPYLEKPPVILMTE